MMLKHYYFYCNPLHKKDKARQSLKAKYLARSKLHAHASFFQGLQP